MENIKDKRLVDITLGELADYLNKTAAKTTNVGQWSDQNNGFLKVSGCAQLTGYTEDYIRQLVFKKKIPFTKVNNRSLRFIYDEIIAWMKSTSKTTNEDAVQKHISNSNIFKKGRSYNL